MSCCFSAQQVNFKALHQMYTSLFEQLGHTHHHSTSEEEWHSSNTKRWHRSPLFLAQDHCRQKGSNYSWVSCLWHELPASWYITCIKNISYVNFTFCLYIITYIHEGNGNLKPCWNMHILPDHMGVPNAARCRGQLPRSGQIWKAAMGLWQPEHALDCTSRARRYNYFITNHN